jgi:hypothetical protein
MFAKELARRYGNQGIVSTSLYPGIAPPLFALQFLNRLIGVLKNDLLRHLGSILKFIVVRFFMLFILIYICDICL